MTNPFFEPSALPYGLPPFAEIADEHYLEAYERGMAKRTAGAVSASRVRTAK